MLILKYLQECGLSCNPGYNILAIYCLSVKVRFITSIQKLILSITDFELLHELPNDVKLRILGNHKIIRKSQNWVGARSRMSNLPSKNKFFTIVLKNYANIYIKVFCSCLVYFSLISLIFAKYFQNISISTKNFQKKSLTLPKFFSSISLTLYDFFCTKRQTTQ